MAKSSDGPVEHLTFPNGCMVRVPFRELVPAVAAAGFEAITLWPNTWRHALRRDGLDLTTMRSLLDEHGLVLTDCETCRNWTPDGPGTLPGVTAGRHEMFEVCAALGGSTVVAVHAGDDFVLDRDAEAFAALCDEAAEHGLRIALEFVPFTTVRDVGTAWTLVETAGRANSGLVFDVWHHVRSRASDGAVARVPASRIFTVQLADGPATAPGPDLVHEAVHGRQLPGEGEMDNAGALRMLLDMGVRANIGPEVAVPAGTRPAGEWARELMAATRATLAAAGVP